VAPTPETFKILSPLTETKRLPVFRFCSEDNGRLTCCQDGCTQGTVDHHVSNLEQHLMRGKTLRTKTHSPRCSGSNGKGPNRLNLQSVKQCHYCSTSAQKCKKTLQQSTVTKFESSFSLIQLLQVRRCPARSRFTRMQGARGLSRSAQQTQNEMRIRMNGQLSKI
jgi:hypothetical protein